MDFKTYYTRNQLANEVKKGIAAVGDYTYGNPHILHYGEKARLVIGKYCSISTNVYIFLGGNHRVDWITTYPFSAPELNDIWPEARNISGHPSTRGDVIIGNDVWIGHGATILSGVKIGDGAVIGSMAVVTKDVRPYSIIAGNPGREIKRRFNDETIEKLLKLQWWNWSEQKIKDNINSLLNSDINEVLGIK